RLCDDPRVLKLVERAVAKADREGLHRLRALSRHVRDDGAGVEATGEERAERHVAHEPDAHGLLDETSQLGRGLVDRDLYLRRVPQAPVPTDARPAVAERQRVSGLDLPDPRERGPRRRDVAE